MGNFIQVLATLFLYLASPPLSVDKKEFYEVVSSKSEKTISQYIARLEKVAAKEKEAYKGTLLMTKAGLVSGPRQKLSLFKEGAQKLEAEIKKDPENPEYRFLRIIIQENAPGILGYKDNINDDKAFLVTHYKSMENAVQEAILDYSKNSKVLQKEDFSR